MGVHLHSPTCISFEAWVVWHSNYAKYGTEGAGGQIDSTLVWVQLSGEAKVQQENDQNQQNDVLSHPEEDGEVAEDSEEHIWENECDDSEGISRGVAMVGVGDILDQGNPAERKTKDRNIRSEVDFVPEGINVFLAFLPGRLDSAGDVEEESEDDLNRRLKGSVDQACQL